MASAISSGNNRDDLQSIQRQIHDTKTRILDSADNMRVTVHETAVLGESTLGELVEQGERLRNIDRQYDSIDANLIQAQRDINKLSSRFGGLKNFFRPPKSAFHKSASQSRISDMKEKKSTPANTTTTSRTTNSKDDTDTYLGKPRSEMDEIEQKIEDRLYDVHQGVGHLKILAEQMNLEIRNQEPVLEGLVKKAGDLQDDTNKKNKQMRKILRR